MDRSLGQEIRRLRTKAEYTLRKFALDLGISAAYVSDIEHDRRRPPDQLLKRMVEILAKAGASYEALQKLDTRMDPDVRLWANATPGVREMLRMIRETGQDPREILRKLEEAEDDRKDSER